MRISAAALGASLGLAGMAAAQEFTLRATANSNDQDEDYDGLVVFKNYVESASNGAIAVELFIGTQLCGNGAECLQGIADGSIDIFISTSGGAAGIFPYIQVMDLPYLLTDDRLAERVLVIVHGRLAAAGTRAAIRDAMNDRPRQVLVRSSDRRALAAELLSLASVTGVSMHRQTGAGDDGVVVETMQASELAGAIARAARRTGVRLLEVRPLDDSLESLFRELVR